MQLPGDPLRFLIDGNWRQVLREALKRSHDITLENVQTPELREAMNNPSQLEAFVCNHLSTYDGNKFNMTAKELLRLDVDHWFAIRKMDGVFWNLDSTLPAPQVRRLLSLLLDGVSLRCSHRKSPSYT